MKIGILGGGQLGRMLALAGYPLGLQFRFLDPSPDAPAGQLAEHVAAAYDDMDALSRFTDGLDAITYEFENVPVGTVDFLTHYCPVYPPREVLAISQDRVLEKEFFRSCGIPTAPFAPVAAPEELEEAIAKIGLPAVLKTRRFGYDGKGQIVLRELADIALSQPLLEDAPCILEGFVPFDRELSLIAARGQDGATKFYPLVENHHRDGILRLSLAPAPNVSRALQAVAEEYARSLFAELPYVGILTIEFFLQGDQLIANEMAPRVHNSGHWTIEEAQTSQFENHIRAVAGLPLGATETIGFSAMVNLIGELPEPSDVLRLPNAHLHLYGKASRPGRKVGHITLRDDDPARLRRRLDDWREHPLPGMMIPELDYAE